MVTPGGIPGSVMNLLYESYLVARRLLSMLPKLMESHTRQLCTSHGYLAIPELVGRLS